MLLSQAFLRFFDHAMIRIGMVRDGLANAEKKKKQTARSSVHFKISEK